MMNVKIFKIRLEETFLQADKKALDRFLSDHEILKFDSAFVAGEENFWSVIVYYGSILPSVNEPKAEKYSANDEVLSEGEAKILHALKNWRTEKAEEKNLPAYCVATNKELFALAKFKPMDIKDFSEIKGFGRYKTENYAREILELLEND